MKIDNNQNKWHQAQGKKRPNWGILTLNNLPKTEGPYSQLRVKLRDLDKASKWVSDDPSTPKTEDYSN